MASKNKLKQELRVLEKFVNGHTMNRFPFILIGILFLLFVMYVVYYNISIQQTYSPQWLLILLPFYFIAIISYT